VVVSASEFKLINNQDNLPIIRDSVSLSLHTRQYPAAIAARHHLLLLRPNARAHWVGLMVAHQLNGHHEEAIKVYDGLKSTIQTEGATPAEQSQLALNIVKACIAAGQPEDAVRRLDSAIEGKTLAARGEATQIRGEFCPVLSY
jgi:peptide alpha-N-acetyltransferase